MALMAGTAYAGCNFGSHVAADESQTPVLAAAEDITDPKLLARLQAQEDAESLEKLLETPAVHN
jgi:hypothetical protein